MSNPYPDSFGEHHRLRERRRRFRIVVILTPALVGLIMLLYLSSGVDVDEPLMPDVRRLLALSAVFGLGTSVAFALMLYLQRGVSAFTGRFDEPRDFASRGYESVVHLDARIGAITNSLRQEIQQLRESVNTTPSSSIEMDAAHRQSIVDGLLSVVKEQAATQLLEELRQHTRADVAVRARLEAVDSAFQMAIARLQAELASLNRRGNLNLVIGIMTTAAGLLVLGVVVFGARDFTRDTASILSYYIPRVSLALFIELFAYFFLNLYKQSLGEIKYFQNELTNLEQRLAAARSLSTRMRQSGHEFSE